MTNPTIYMAWTSILVSGIIRHRPSESYLMIENDTGATPLGTLCLVAHQLMGDDWPLKGVHPNQLEYPPAGLIVSMGLECYSTPEGEAVGKDIDWINAMTEAGIPDSMIGRTIRKVVCERERLEAIKPKD